MKGKPDTNPRGRSAKLHGGKLRFYAGRRVVAAIKATTKCCKAPEILVRAYVGCMDFHAAPYDDDNALLKELEEKHSVAEGSEFWLDDSICVMVHVCAACRKPTTKPWIEHG